MKLEHVSPVKLKTQLLGTIGKHLDLNKYKVFVFGSRVAPTKHDTERSDIDIGIEGPGPIPLSKFSKISEEIEELPVLYTIEIVDFKTLSKDFYKVAKKYTEPLN